MYPFSPKPITFLYLLFLSLPTFIFSLSRTGAKSGEEWLEKEEQRVWTSLILSVAFCWLTFCVFNHHDYGRYLKLGISVQFGRESLWGLCAPLVFFSPDWALSLIESIKGALCLLPFAIVHMAHWKLVHLCLTKPWDSSHNFWLIFYPAKQTALSPAFCC